MNGAPLSDEPVRLRPGEEHVVRLPGRGVSGYRWETAVDGSAVDVRPATEPEAGAAPGAGGGQILTVRAVELGRAVVTLTRRRRFGPSDPDAESRTLIVEVSED